MVLSWTSQMVELQKVPLMVLSMMVHDQQQTPKEPLQKDQQTVPEKALSMMVLDQVHWQPNQPSMDQKTLL